MDRDEDIQVFQEFHLKMMNVEKMSTGILDQRNVFLESNITKATELCLKTAACALGFEIIELWTECEDEPKCIYCYVDEEIQRNCRDLLVGHYPNHKKDHKISPELCRKAKESNDGVYWKTYEKSTCSPGSFFKENNDGFRHLDSGFVVKCEFGYKLECGKWNDETPIAYLIGFSGIKVNCNDAKIRFMSGLGHSILAAFELEDDNDNYDEQDHVTHFEMHTPRPRSSISLNKLADIAGTGITDMEIESVYADSKPGSPLIVKRKTLSADESASVDNIKVSVHDGSGLWELELEEDKVPHHFPLSKIPSKKYPSNLVFDDFTQVDHIIDGSNSNIYSGYLKDEKVLIKMIKDDVKSNSIAIHEFLIELAILSRLNHTHICKLIGSGIKPRRFIVLEYLGGGSLNVLLDKTQSSGITNKLFKKPTFSYLELLRRAREIASALDYIHSKFHPGATVIHRDLKPDNIGFTKDGDLRLFDFGLSICVKSRTSLDEAYEMSGNTGSLRYMAPEVALGQPYTEKADVYSFAIIFWQMARGKVPFKGMSRANFTNEVVIGGERPKLDKHWPPSLTSLITDCWHINHLHRPSFETIIERIDSMLLEDTKKSWFRAVTVSPVESQKKVKSFSFF